MDKFEYIGLLDPSIAKYWEIIEHQNKPILCYDDRIQHVIDEHLKEFGSIEAINKIYKNLPNIIKRPNYVFYNQETKGLEYYKKFDDNICVAVRIKPGKVLKIRSWYPVNEYKLLNRKRKEIEMMAEKEQQK